jgi:Uncharacterized protein conserved in bacteria
MKNMNVSFTGPRPSSLGNCYKFKHKRRVRLRKYIKEQIDLLIISQILDDPEEEIRLYFGMALGIDQDAFQVCMELRDHYTNVNIKLYAIVPFRNMYKAWKSENDRARYFNYLNKADEVIYVDELEGTKYYSEQSNEKEDISNKLKVRNKYLVDILNGENDRLYAYPVENKKASGTKHCINYAKKKNVKIVLTELSFKS